MDMNEESWQVVRNTPRVMGFIGGTSDRPAPISQKEADAILNRIEDSGDKPRPKVLFEACEMVRVTDGPFAEISIFPIDEAGSKAVAGATIVVPLETLLTEQLTLRVDGGTARRFPFNFCNVGGCVTRLGLTNQDIALFKRGASATLTMVPAAAPDQTVTVTMSLSGFTAAYDAVSQ